MAKEEVEQYYPSTVKQWRAWLQKNHEKKQSIWLVHYKVKSGKPSISWAEAVEEALCFGWIDSTRKTVDEEQYIQFFTRRKPGSMWSKINKAKVEQLIAEGRMMPAGLTSIEIAKQNGSWDILNEVDELIVPPDLLKAFNAHKGSKEFFSGLSKSVRKMMLYWITSAKREETRAKRIAEIAELTGKGLKPKQF